MAIIIDQTDKANWKVSEIIIISKSTSSKMSGLLRITPELEATFKNFQSRLSYKHYTMSADEGSPPTKKSADGRIMMSIAHHVVRPPKFLT